MIDNKIKEFIESLIEEERKEFMNNLNKESTLGLEKKELAINDLVEEAHKNARDKGFWDFCIQETDEMYKTDCVLTNEIHGLTLTLIINGFLTLIASEVFEAQQALRKNDKANFKEEIADIFIRAADLCGGLGIDIEEEIIKKMEYNKGREKMHGKLF